MSKAITVQSGVKFRKRVQRSFTAGSSKTRQEFKDQCDVNKIIKSYSRTGMINHVTRIKAKYGDFSDLPSFEESSNILIKAEQAFMELPAKVREAFGNDPARFVEASKDPSLSEFRKLGLVGGSEPSSPSEVAPQGEPSKKPPKASSDASEA